MDCSLWLKKCLRHLFVWLWTISHFHISLHAIYFCLLVTLAGMSKLRTFAGIVELNAIFEKSG